MFMRISRSVGYLAMLLLLVSVPLQTAGCGGQGGAGTSTSSTATTTSPSSASAPSSSTTPSIALTAVGDQTRTPVSTLVVGNQGAQAFKVELTGLPSTGGAAPPITVSSNRGEVARVTVQEGNVLVVSPLQAGRAGLKVQVPSLGLSRSVGLTVLDATGKTPGLPAYMAIGSMDKSFLANRPLWEAAPVDLRYVYLQGGFTSGWYNQYPGTGRMVTQYITDSDTVGMIPVFVYYQLPGGGGDSAQGDYDHINDETFMTDYLTDYVRALEKINGAGFSLMILEPDFIGYMMQNYSASLTKTPDQIPAVGMSALYKVKDSAGNLIATAGGVPGVPVGGEKNVQAYVLAMNYLAKKYAPNCRFGWKMNIWSTSYPGSDVPQKGVVHYTDGLTGAAFTTARAKVVREAGKIGTFYQQAGVADNGATYLFLDRYGIDGGAWGYYQNGSLIGFTTAQAVGWQDPQQSLWFWNLIQCNNYVQIIRTVNGILKLPVGLWQIPMGHLNSSQTTNSLDWNPVVLKDERFPDLIDGAYATQEEWQPIMGSTWKGDPGYGSWEDATATFIFGDTFSVTTACGGNSKLKDGLTSTQVDNRLAFLGLADPDEPSGLTVKGSQITYARHTKALADAGVVMIMFGPGVGQPCTMGTGWNDPYDPTWGQKHPQDWYWWVNKVYQYYQNKEILLQ